MSTQSIKATSDYISCKDVIPLLVTQFPFCIPMPTPLEAVIQLYKYIQEISKNSLEKANNYLNKSDQIIEVVMRNLSKYLEAHIVYISQTNIYRSFQPIDGYISFPYDITIYNTGSKCLGLIPSVFYEQCVADTNLDPISKLLSQFESGIEESKAVSALDIKEKNPHCYIEGLSNDTQIELQKAYLEVNEFISTEEYKKIEQLLTVAEIEIDTDESKCLICNVDMPLLIRYHKCVKPVKGCCLNCIAKKVASNRNFMCPICGKHLLNGDNMDFVSLYLKHTIFRIPSKSIEKPGSETNKIDPTIKLGTPIITVNEGERTKEDDTNKDQIPKTTKTTKVGNTTKIGNTTKLDSQIVEPLYVLKNRNRGEPPEYEKKII